MKKMCKALALTLCTVMLLSTLTVVGDPGVKTVLTLEEAKKIALEDNTQYKLQQSYIEQKAEDYDDVFDLYDGKPKGIFKTKADYAAAEITYEMNIQNAAFAFRKEVFKKGDLKRKSDYEVTIAYYDVMKSKLTLDDEKRSMDLAKKDFDVAKIKLEFGLITKNSFAQIENAYNSSQTAYNKAFTDVQNNMAALSNSISKDLDVSNDDIDMTISIPDIKSLDIDQIKKDYMNKNESYYLLREQLSLAKFKKEFTQDRYDEYTEETRSRNSDTMKDFEDMVYKADRDYNDQQYQYDENIKDLDITLKSQYTGIINLAETIENLEKSIEDARTTFEQNKTKYDLGLISRIDFEKSESALKDLENTLNTTVIAFNTQYLALTQYSYKQEK